MQGGKGKEGQFEMHRHGRECAVSDPRFLESVWRRGRRVRHKKRVVNRACAERIPDRATRRWPPGPPRSYDGSGSQRRSAVIPTLLPRAFVLFGSACSSEAMCSIIRLDDFKSRSSGPADPMHDPFKVGVGGTPYFPP